MLKVAVVLAGLVFLGQAFAGAELETAHLGHCQLDNGDVIQDCTLGYRRVGELAADKSNVVIVPSWYTGSSQVLLDTGAVGPGQIVDTNRFHVVAIDALANGVSSSPSNSERQSAAAFPAISIGDMVHTSHRLVTETLGFEQVHAVVGISMGGIQVFEWLVRYPQFMQRAVSIEGTPWPTSYDLMLWGAWRDAGELAVASADNEARARSLLSALDGLTLWTPPLVNQMFPAADYAKLEAFLNNDASNQADRLRQTNAMLAHDIRKRFAFAGSSILAEEIKARTLIVVFDQDQMVNPGPSIELAGLIKAQLEVIETPCGHMGTDSQCEHAAVAEAVQGFLSAE